MEFMILGPIEVLSPSLRAPRRRGAGDPKESDMIRTGTVIENPVTGERIVFRKTSRDTGGQAVVIETFVQPHGFVAAAHVHPSQEERFEVLRGTVGFKIGREKIVAGPGTRVTVPAGTSHKFWNAGDTEAQFVCEVRPALQFESLLETRRPRRPRARLRGHLRGRRRRRRGSGGLAMRRKLYLAGLFLALCFLAALGPVIRLGRASA
jgi:quercetin dioxygenase-like cupin family protein